VIFPPLEALRWQTTTVVNETNRFNVLRLRYKAAFDAFRSIATRNGESATSGVEPSEQDLATEQRAAAELKKARANLVAAGVLHDG
jgi:hypothetical protein